MVEFMATSSKRACAIPRPAAPRALPLRQATADHALQETLRHCSGSGSGWVSGSLCPQGLLEPSEHPWWAWSLTLNAIHPSYRLAGASPLPLDVGFLAGASPLPLDVGFPFGGTRHLPADSCPAARGNCGVLAGEGERTASASCLRTRAGMSGPCVCTFSCSVVSSSLGPHGLWPARLTSSVHGILRAGARVGSHSLLQGSS